MNKYWKHKGQAVVFSGTAEELDKFEKNQDHLSPDDEITESEFDVLAVEADKDAIRKKRAEEYPPIGDQLDAIMKWLATETEFGIPAELKSLSMKCMSVKSKYPIPE